MVIRYLWVVVVKGAFVVSVGLIVVCGCGDLCVRGGQCSGLVETFVLEVGSVVGL